MKSLFHDAMGFTPPSCVTTMHLVMSPEHAPAFYHRLPLSPWHCLTVRGEAQCACGRYKLCDPLVQPCGAACTCQCHAGEGALHDA